MEDTPILAPYTKGIIPKFGMGVEHHRRIAARQDLPRLFRLANLVETAVQKMPGDVRERPPELNGEQLAEAT